MAAIASDIYYPTRNVVEPPPMVRESERIGNL